MAYRNRPSAINLLFQSLHSIYTFKILNFRAVMSLRGVKPDFFILQRTLNLDVQSLFIAIWFNFVLFKNLKYYCPLLIY